MRSAGADGAGTIGPDALGVGRSPEMTLARGTRGGGLSTVWPVAVGLGMLLELGYTCADLEKVCDAAG